MNRTGWLGVALLGLAGWGGVVAHAWPSSDPALPCRAEDVRWTSRRGALVAHCAPGEAAGPVPTGEAMALGLQLDLNRATEADLEQVGGIGPVLAKALMSARGRLGAFRSWDDVDSVTGVGPAKLRVLRSVFRIGQNPD